MPRKPKPRKVDNPPTLRPVAIKALSPAEDGVIVHQQDARNGKPCDVLYHWSQVAELRDKLDSALAHRKVGGADG